MKFVKNWNSNRTRKFNILPFLELLSSPSVSKFNNSMKDFEELNQYLKCFYTSESQVGTSIK